MLDPKVSIIILTYKNGLSNVERCLNSLRKVKSVSFEIILVDNASTDETVKIVKKNYPEVKILENKVNLGFCKGNNYAVKFARGKYLLFLNNDTEVTPDFLSPLASILDKDDTVGVVQPKIRQLKDKSKLDACASYLTDTGFLYHYGYAQSHKDRKYNHKLSIYSVKGACFLTRKSLIKKISLFDEDFFAYFEETDFCHRVWLAGYKVCYIPDSEIYHLGGVDTEVSPVIFFHSYKNRIASYIKNLEFKTFVPLMLIHIIICLGMIVTYLFRFKFSHSTSVMRAILWNIMNINKTISKRRFVQQKLRKVSDNKLLPVIKKHVKVSYYKHFFFAPRGFYEFEEI